MSTSTLESAPTADVTAGGDVARLMRERRTIHDFVPGRVPPRELVLKAIDVARWAPNHHVTEPWHFYLLGPRTVESVARLNGDIVAHAKGEAAGRAKYERWRAIPGWLLLTCERSDDERRAREDYAACCCALQNLQLYLWSEGVGVKWSTGAVTRDPRFFDLVWVEPEAESVVGLMSYGYAAEVPQTGRKPVAEVLVALP